jgi:tubulin beta
MSTMRSDEQMLNVQNKNSSYFCRVGSQTTSSLRDIPLRLQDVQTFPATTPLIQEMFKAQAEQFTAMFRRKASSVHR